MVFETQVGILIANILLRDVNWFNIGSEYSMNGARILLVLNILGAIKAMAVFTFNKFIFFKIVIPYGD